MNNSLEYYRQAAADSDDSDCELLKHKPLFQSRKKPKQNQSDSPSRVSLSQSSLESNSSTPIEEIASRQPVLTEEKIEAKAQEMIKDLHYPGLGDTKSTEQLGWHKAPRRKGAKENTWYPCRRATDDERIGLVRNSSKGKILVRYLGYQSDTARQFGVIKETQYIPLTAENRESGMETYMRHLQKHFKRDAVRCRAEVLAVLEMWRKVEKREIDSTLRANSATKKAKTTTTRRAPSAAKNAILNRTLPECGESSDDGNGLDFEDTEERNSSKKAPLQTGDVIEYYNPIGVAGKPQWLNTATILGVVAKGVEFPLNLDTGDCLDRTVRVKRVKRLRRQKLETCHGAAFKGMSEYGLKSGGTMEMIGVKAKIEKAKRMRDEFDAQVQDFWRAPPQESKEEEKAVTTSNVDSCLNFQDHMTETDPGATDEVSMIHMKTKRLSRPLAQRNQNTYKDESKRKSTRTLRPRR